MNTKDDFQEIKKNINLLPYDYRDIFDLFYNGGLPPRQISLILNLSIGKVTHHLSKGKYLIKKALGNQKYEKAFELLYKYDCMYE